MTTDLITAPPALVAVPMMDADEAREYVQHMHYDLEAIDERLANFRARALDFKDREGWRALGYSGFIEAIRAECGSQYSKSYLSRLVQAAEIERVLELPMATPESHLRPLTALDTPEAQRAAWQRADELRGDEPRQAKHVRQAVAEQRPVAPAPRVCARCNGPWGAAGSMVTEAGKLCQDCAPVYLETLAKTQAAVAQGRVARTADCEHCGAPATLRRNLRGMLAWRCAHCDAEQARLQADEASEADIVEAASPYPEGGAIAALRAALDRAEALGATYDPTQQRADGRMPVLAPAGFGSPGEWIHCDADELTALCDAWERTKATPPPQATEAERWRSGVAIRQQAGALLKALAPLMREIETEDLIGLSQAITDLSESPERGEAPYWINVGWALLDLDPDDKEGP